MGKRLDGKVALILGAGAVGPGWGNGRATSVLFAREGAKVVGVDISMEAARDTESVVHAEGGTFEAAQADVTRPEDVKRVVDLCMERHGRIDVLQNNVGLTHLGGPVEMTHETWRQSMEVNVGYMFSACKYVLPIMERQGSGAIVNVSSIASLRWLGIEFVGYSTFKAAVNQFTQTVAMQYARKGIRANVVVPGRMDTPTAKMQLKTLYKSEEELLAERAATCPSGKQGDGWDIAYASLFLASDEAKYISGVILPVDGGVTCCS